MNGKTVLASVLATVLVAGAGMAEELQWVRVTVLLERGPGQAQRTAETLIRGGIYSLDEVERRGQEAIDREIMERVRFLAGEMDDVRKSMRLGDLLQRQYYLPLRLTEQAVVPVIDLNPRLGIVIEPLRFAGDQVVCRIRFLEPEGRPGATQYKGEPVSLTLKDAALQDVIKIFSRVAEHEISYDTSVSGTVTLDLRDVPWDQALDLVLRTNGLGWRWEGDRMIVHQLDELSRRRRVRTEASINLPRAAGGTATIASRGDEQNRTVVVVLESVDREPELVAERDGLVHPPALEIITEKAPGGGPLGDVLVLRGVATENGALEDLEVLSDPIGIADNLEPARSWQPWTVLDEQVRRIPAVVGYGLRISTAPAVLDGLKPISIPERLGVDLKVRRKSDEADTFAVSAFVKDLVEDRIISAPRIPVRSGKEGVLRAVIPGPGGDRSNFEARVLISENGRHVSYSWTVTREGTVISSHSAEFEL